MVLGVCCVMQRALSFSSILISVTALVLLVGTGIYANLSLSPVALGGSRLENVAGLQAVQYEGKPIIANAHDLEVKLLNNQAQLLGESGDIAVVAPLSPVARDLQPLLQIYNPNYGDVAVYVSAKVPQVISSILLLDLKYSSESVQLSTPADEALRLVKITIPARQTIELKAETVQLEQINFPAQITYNFDWK
jgi:hypothetical protein